MVRERQQRLLDEQRRKLEDLKRLPGAAGPGGEAAPGGGGCVPAGKIQAEGATLVPEAELRGAAAPFEGRCLDGSALDALLGALTRPYLARGLVTSRAYLPPQDPAGGTLRVLIVEGRLESLKAEGGVTAREARMAFPGREGGPLSLRELEQLADNLARLPSKAAALDLLPGQAPGGSAVLVKGPSQKEGRLALRYDNLGDRATGERQAGITVAWDSPLGLADQLTLSGAHAVAQHGGRDSESLGLGYSLPWGWWLFSARYGASHYESRIDAGGASLATHGKSETSGLRAERVLHRDGEGKTAAAAGLSHMESGSYIEDVRLGASSYRLTELEASLSHGRRVGRLYANADLGWQGGIALGAQGRGSPRGSQPDARYSKFTLALSALWPFQLAGQDFSLEGFGFGQTSAAPLHSPQRVGLGGPGSVRAYKDQTRYGNTGAYGRGQLRWRRGITAGWLKPYVSSAGAALGYDLGAVRKNRGQGDEGARMAGYAAEVSLAGPYLAASLTVARPQGRRPRGAVREHPVYLNISLSY